MAKKKVRILFSSEIWIEGDNYEDMRNEWYDLQVFSDEAIEHGAEFVHHISVEDADRNNVLTSFFRHGEDK